MSFEEGKKLIQSLYIDTYNIKLIHIPVLILHSLNTFVNESVNEIDKHFYYKDESAPFLVSGTELQSDTLIRVYTLEDLTNVLTHGTSVTVAGDVNNFRLTKDNLKHHIKYITVGISNKILLNMMLNYLESQYMLCEHPESNIVLTDVFNISNKIPLVDLTYNDFNKFSLLLEYTIGLHSQTLKDIIDRTYTELYQYVISNITNNSTSKSFTIKGYNISIAEYTPPSGVRFLLNSYINEQRDVESVETANDIALKEKVPNREVRWIYD